MSMPPSSKRLPLELKSINANSTKKLREDPLTPCLIAQCSQQKLLTEPQMLTLAISNHFQNQLSQPRDFTTFPKYQPFSSLHSGAWGTTCLFKHFCVVCRLSQIILQRHPITWHPQEEELRISLHCQTEQTRQMGCGSLRGDILCPVIFSVPRCTSDDIFRYCSEQQKKSM